MNRLMGEQGNRQTYGAKDEWLNGQLTFQT